MKTIFMFSKASSILSTTLSISVEVSRSTDRMPGCKEPSLCLNSLLSSVQSVPSIVICRMGTWCTDTELRWIPDQAITVVSDVSSFSTHLRDITAVNKNDVPCELAVRQGSKPGWVGEMCQAHGDHFALFVIWLFCWQSPQICPGFRLAEVVSYSLLHTCRLTAVVMRARRPM